LLVIVTASAALACAGAPAAARHLVGTGIPDAKVVSVPVVQSFPGPLTGGVDSFRHHGRRGHGDFRRDRGGFDEGFGSGWAWYGGGSTYDDADWAPDSGNDWWHDRPDRAFPRWVAHNENCTPDRMWWSGSGWHC
jgi:hypothetical protein